jgi:hypothetical protein
LLSINGRGFEMDLLRRRDLDDLMKPRDELCVSLYVPTHRRGRKTSQNSIRFKNILARVKRRLAGHGLKAGVVVELLSPAENLLDDTLFWQHQSDGLVVFFSAGFFRLYRAPVAFKELAIVASRRFYIKPLLPLLTGNGRFYMLAVSQKNVRLLQGSHYAIHELNLSNSDIPENLGETLRFDDPQSQLQFHTGTTDRVGKRAAIYHGQGVGTEERKNNILRFFREIDRGLGEYIADEKAPLVFCGVDYLFPIYREANSYPHLVDTAVAGNPEHLDDESLHAAAWGIVSPAFLKAQEDAKKTIEDLNETSKTSNSIATVLPAAGGGRVDVLFVALDKEKWGTFDPAIPQVRLHSRRMPGDEDLLDTCAVQTILHDGTVYAVDCNEVPGEQDIAALFRY